MTPPDSNIEKQKRRHRPALIGIAAAGLFALIVVLALLFATTDGERPLTDQATPDATDTMDATGEM